MTFTHNRPLTPGGGGPAMLLPPDVNYPYLPAPQQAQQPLSEDEVIDADANFDFSSHQRPFRTNASKAGTGRTRAGERAGQYQYYAKADPMRAMQEGQKGL
jgi:hypothetical protein